MDELDLTLPSPAENLALDEALLLDAEAGRAGEVLRFWELPKYAVVLGVSGVLAEDVREEACRAEGVPVLRRCSGGGTVLLGPGCLNFSLVLDLDRPGLRDVTRSYGLIMDRVATALSAGAAALTRAGSSDLATAERKVSGNAQRRLRRFLLHHGTLLYGFDLARIDRYLHEPRRQPEYRRERAHNAFVTNLPLPAPEIKDRLRRAWGAASVRTNWPEELIRRLVEEKYGRDDWSRRR
jgi:lipoate-protein ligase A